MNQAIARITTQQFNTASVQPRQALPSVSTVSMPASSVPAASAVTPMQQQAVLQALLQEQNMLMTAYLQQLQTANQANKPLTASAVPSKPTNSTTNSASKPNTITPKQVTPTASTATKIDNGKKTPARLEYVRKKDSIEGTLRILDGNGKVITTLPARSGQTGHTQGDWETNKSPIPHTKKDADFFLHLQPLAGQAGTVFASKADDTGKFYPISSSESNTEKITSADSKKVRTNVGLHTEDVNAGSKGCVVLLWDTPERKKQVEDFYATLDTLAKTQSTIRLSVINA
jgi:hypothetical protein